MEPSLAEATEPRRVLIVDEDAEIRGAYAQALEGAGWTVVQMANGLEALRVIAKRQATFPRPWPCSARCRSECRPC